MSVVINGLLFVLYSALELYKYILIASVIMSWLVAFGVINDRNRFVYTIGDFLERITEPALRPIRRFVPLLGGIDLSPLILFFIIMFLQYIIVNGQFRG